MSFARTVVTAGLVSLSLGAMARAWSVMRHGPAWIAPPPDCPPLGAHVMGLAMSRRVLGSTRGAPVIVAVHDRGSSGDGMLEALGGLSARAILLAPTAPMPEGLGAAWIGPAPGQPGFAAAVRSAALGLGACVRELRRCNPGRPLYLVAHGQGAHVSLAAAILEPTLADAIVLAGAWLPPDVPVFALPSTTLIHAEGDDRVPLEAAHALAKALSARGLPVRRRAVAGPRQLAGGLQAAVLAELEQRITTKEASA